MLKCTNCFRAGEGSTHVAAARSIISLHCSLHMLDGQCKCMPLMDGIQFSFRPFHGRPPWLLQGHEQSHGGSATSDTRGSHRVLLFFPLQFQRHKTQFYRYIRLLCICYRNHMLSFAANRTRKRYELISNLLSTQGNRRIVLLLPKVL